MIFKYFWFFIIIVNLINANNLKVKSRKYIAESPGREDGYNKIIKIFIIYANIPWFIMGAGILSGLTVTVFDYIRPSDFNPAVLAFYASLLTIWLYGFYWIFFKHGADFLSEHPGLFMKKKKDITSPRLIKFYSAVTVIGGIIIMIILWFGNINLNILR
jgi:hypothetical protein